MSRPGASAPGHFNKTQHDAGTDAGMTFVTPDVMEVPVKPISMIACGDADAFCLAPGDIEPVATITVTKM